MDTPNSITRRLFLKGAPVAAAMVTLPAVAAPALPEAADSPAPDRLSRINVNGAVYVIDTLDFDFEGFAECVVVRFDGSLSVDKVRRYDMEHRLVGPRLAMRRLNTDTEACIILGRLVEGVEP